LKLASGQVINVLQIIEDGWWIGEVDGRKGFFPSNFVSEMSDLPSDSNQVDTVDEPSTIPTGNTVIARVKALYQYDPQDPAELRLKEGDDIEVYQKNEDGWWYGQVTSSGERGLFPSNYVEG